MQMNNILIDLINSEKADCVLYNNEEIVTSEKGRGIKPLFTIYNKYLRELEGSLVLDKVIGKGAAILLCKAKVGKVYTKLISKKALELLEQYSITVEYEDNVEYIQNREKTGMCPLEKRVFNITDIDKGFEEILVFVNDLNN